MGNFYNQLVIKVSSHYDLFSDFLSDTLPIGFEETKDGFIVRSEDDLSTISWGIEQFAEALQKALGEQIVIDFVLTKEDNDDWIVKYQNSVTPIKIKQFYIHPSWEKSKQDMVNIIINPALAFGTGHHFTTVSCIEAISKYLKKEDDVIDVGCGSGILGICAMKLGARVDSCDTDEISIKNSLENAKLNQVTYTNIWHGTILLTTKRYDIVVANIVADVLELIANDLIKILKPKAILILSGILQKYQSKILKSYQSLTILEKIEQDEWVTIILQKDN